MSNGAKLNDMWAVFDPWRMFRTMRDASLEYTAKQMVDLVNTEEYAQATGVLLDAYFDCAEPIRAWMDKTMPQILAHYGMPSRREVTSVAARLTNIEMQLDDMRAAFDELRQALLDQEQERKVA